jgi:hypothetical protein
MPLREPSSTDPEEACGKVVFEFYCWKVSLLIYDLGVQQ